VYLSVSARAGYVASSTISVRDSVVARNTALGASGGGIYAEIVAFVVATSAVTVVRVQAIDNTVSAALWGAAAYGGNIRIVVPREELADSYCADSTPSSGGVVLYSHDVSVVVTDSRIIGGSANCLTCAGGGLSISSGGNVTLHNVTFESCSAGFGGALALGDDSLATCDATLSSVTFSRNKAVYGSAAVMHKCSGNLTVRASSFSLELGSQQVCSLRRMRRRSHAHVSTADRGCCRSVRVFQRLADTMSSCGKLQR
jgi:predicted outer membrane repeat protein